MTKTILAALLASFLVAGCAADPATAASNERAEPVYRTGSNIAVKNRDSADPSVTTMSREDLERQRMSTMPAGTIPKSN
jgi:uncharacterized lipoprotein YajG